ncbi:MAG: hypothetical protein FVQ77_16135, partial [Cytophagales bacterium]|nr:hypothetical protein [Cytophagales bacterium]
YDGVSSLRSEQAFTTYTTAQGLAHNAVVSITEDKSGNLWFGTLGGGVSFLRVQVKKEIKEIKGIKGIKEIRFENLTTKDGLADDVVYDLVEDTEGNMVFGTNLGYSVLIGGASSPVFSGGLAKWEIYNNNTGYPIKDLNTNAMCITKDGIIWGGCGDDKVIRFDPKAVHKNYEPPTVVLQKIKVNQENICWYVLPHATPQPPEGGEPRAGAWESDSRSGSHSAGKHSEQAWDSDDSATLAQQEIMTYGKVLSQAERDTVRQQFAGIEFDGITKFYPLPENLVLPIQYNHVTFEYNAIETGRHFLVKYQYMLEGQDEKWSPITKKTEVTYGNLYEGEYTFLLKAQSPFGVWSEPLIYRFTVLPPWWRTWWYYTTQVICMAGLLIVSFLLTRRGKTRFSTLISLLTIITIFEFMILLAEPFVDDVAGGVPLFKLLMNILLAAFLNPIEKGISNFFERQKKKRVIKKLKERKKQYRKKPTGLLQATS